LSNGYICFNVAVFQSWPLLEWLQFRDVQKLTFLRENETSCAGMLYKKPEIPSEIGQLSMLTDLDIQNTTGFGGDIIPAELGKLKRLKHLTLARLDMTANVTKFLSETPLLAYLNIDYTRVIGTLPRFRSTIFSMELSESFTPPSKLFPAINNTNMLKVYFTKSTDMIKLWKLASHAVVKHLVLSCGNLDTYPHEAELHTFVPPTNFSVAHLKANFRVPNLVLNSTLLSVSLLAAKDVFGVKLSEIPDANLVHHGVWLWSTTCIRDALIL